MSFDRKYIKSLFSFQDFSRGMEYYANGMVENTDLTFFGDDVIFSCFVQGNHRYETDIYLTDIDGDTFADMHCSCPRFEDRGICKHLAAAMLECEHSLSVGKKVPAAYGDYIPKIPKQVPSGTSPQAKTLIDMYVEKSLTEIPAATAHLMPRLNLIPANGIYPELLLSVGTGKMYVVKNINNFIRNVINRDTVTYGKSLTLFHGIENFDEPSRALIELLMDESEEFSSIIPTYRYSYGYTGSLRPGYSNDAVTLTASAFDRLYNILLRFPDGVRERYGGRLTVGDGNPPVRVTLSSDKGAVRVSVEAPGKTWFFGSRKQLYAWNGSGLLRCGDEFMQWVYPLLSGRDREMRILPDDMPTFCAYVLSKLDGVAAVDDPEGLMEQYTPDECGTRFYFDIDPDGKVLKLEVRFLYGELELTPSDAGYDGLKRNLPAEKEHLAFAGRFLQKEPEDGEFSLSGDDAVYDFLTAGMDEFIKRGEVFISDRLRGMNFRPSPAAVGIGISDGSLLLDIDTGEFPAEELEELYQSLLKKRRYHRLRDGRYLTLDGSSYETLAEMSHMLRLSDKDLKSGHAELPAYRALYIDGLLSERNDVSVSRDSRFRDMARNFKSLTDSDYAVPDGFEKILRPYQKLGFQWLKALESCGFGGILADEMGLGKTVQMIAFFKTASRSAVGKANLVICPASLILNWTDELGKFAPELKAAAIMGTAAEREKLLSKAKNADIVVTSYELLRQDIARYESTDFYCCVLDEGQYIKNSSTLISKAVKRLRCRQRFILTGTPIENRLSELWNLFDFLMPGYLYTHGTFVEKLEKPAVKSGDAEALTRLRRLVKPFMLRRLKKDVLRELPPVIEHVRRISMSKDERKIYLATAAKLKGDLDNGGGKLQILSALTRLRQICCDPALCYENYAGPSGKLEACLELCAGMAQNGHQILLFSQFTSMLDRIRPLLKELGISSFTLQGSTPKEKRAELVRRFNAGESQVFLISLKAGGTGLNLTAADVVIHYDPWWNVTAQDQENGRDHRIGQRSGVQVYKLIATDTIEEKILKLQEDKASLLSSVASDAGGGILSMTKEDLLALLD